MVTSAAVAHMHVTVLIDHRSRQARIAVILPSLAPRRRVHALQQTIRNQDHQVVYRGSSRRLGETGLFRASHLPLHGPIGVEKLGFVRGDHNKTPVGHQRPVEGDGLAKMHGIAQAAVRPHRVDAAGRAHQMNDAGRIHERRVSEVISVLSGEDPTHTAIRVQGEEVAVRGAALAAAGHVDRAVGRHLRGSHDLSRLVRVQPVCPQQGAAVAVQGHHFAGVLGHVDAALGRIHNGRAGQGAAAAGAVGVADGSIRQGDAHQVAVAGRHHHVAYERRFEVVPCAG